MNGRQASSLLRGGFFPFQNVDGPPELICSEIKGGASDRATCNAGESGCIGLFFFLFSFNRWHHALSSFWHTHSLSRSAFWWVWDLKPPCRRWGGPQAPARPPCPLPVSLSHTSSAPLPGALTQSLLACLP